MCTIICIHTHTHTHTSRQGLLVPLGELCMQYFLVLCVYSFRFYLMFALPRVALVVVVLLVVVAGLALLRSLVAFTAKF